MKDLGTLPHTWVLKTQERGRHGVPDLLVCMKGMFIAIELKTDKGKVEKIQDVVLGKINNALGVAFVARPNNWDEVFTRLHTIHANIMQDSEQEALAHRLGQSLH